MLQRVVTSLKSLHTVTLWVRALCLIKNMAPAAFAACRVPDQENSALRNWRRLRMDEWKNRCSGRGYPRLFLYRWLPVGFL